MAQKAVELTLMRQLASYLVVPIFLVDPEGNLLYYNNYNEPAEHLLGRRYDDTLTRLLDGACKDGVFPFEIVPGTEGLSIDPGDAGDLGAPSAAAC